MSAIVRHCQSILSNVPASRSLAIDVFRGITITAMILVNNPGSWQYVYPPLLHAEWHGMTPTDVIFPFFVFIVGLSICFSQQQMQKRGVARSKQLVKIAKRTVYLFTLGLFLAVFFYRFNDPNYSWWQDRIETIRILGVLQRLALVFACCAVLSIFLTKRMLFVVSVLLLAFYTGFMLLMPYSDGSQTFSGQLAFGNSFAAYLDHLLLGPAHVYYASATPFSFDPEGVFSTVPAVVSGLSGVLIGHLLMAQSSQRLKIKQLLLIGICLSLSGWALHFVHPINKALWTAPFVIATSGLACLSLVVLMWLLDEKHYRAWSAPFIVFGANSLLFFMFSGVVARILIMIPVHDQSLQGWLFECVYQPVFGNYNGSLAYAISFLIVSYVVFYALYKRNIFWKV